MSEHANRDLSRREFLKTSGSVAASVVALSAMPLRALEDAVDALGPIPQATLGRSGAKVSILGLGTALMGEANSKRPEIGPLIDVFSEAIDRGVTYVDTARIYGRSEEALGTVLKTRRDKVFLVTKVWANTREEAQKSFEESLATMGVEHVDLLHLHHAGGKDIDVVLGADGAWDCLRDIKKKGGTRFIGITGHAMPAKFVRMLETGTVDAMMVAMNYVDRHTYGFEDKVLPVARKHETGVMAMKVFGGVRGGFQNYQKPRPFPAQMDAARHFDSIRYAKTLEGVTGMVIGVHSKKQLLENIASVIRATPMAKEEFAALVEAGKAEAPVWTPRFGPVE